MSKVKQRLAQQQQKRRVIPTLKEDNTSNQLEALKRLTSKSVRLEPPIVPEMYRNIPVQNPAHQYTHFVPKPFTSPENSRLLRVSLLGAPNSGKSTLLNSLTRSKLSITSINPYSTRHPLVASWTTGQTQLVFVDTPGVSKSKVDATGVRKSMLSSGWDAFEQVDTVLCVLDASRFKKMSHDKDGMLELGPDVEWIVKRFRSLRPSLAYLVLNKIDRVKDRSLMEDGAAKCNDIYRGFADTFMVSSKYDDGMEELGERLQADAKPSDWIYHPEDRLGIPPVRIVKNCVREKLFHMSEDRFVPFWVAYKSEVDVDGWTELPHDALRLDVTVTIRRQRDFMDLRENDDKVLEKLRQRISHDLKRIFKKDIYLYLTARVRDQ